MVQAYTLSDRIVQQGFNDAQFLVGRVYKNDGSVKVSTPQELLDSGAQSVPNYAQVCRYFYKESSTTSPDCLRDLYQGSGNISSLLFDTWSDAGSVNWVQLRRVEVNLIVESPAPSLGAENYYVKLVFDTFQSPLNP